MNKLTRADRMTILATCKRLALMADRAADTSQHAARLYRELRETIAKDEKGHRRFAPAGWRHLFSVEQAVDFFVVRTLADANPNAEAHELARLRDDYVKATFLMCDEAFHRRLDVLVREVWGNPTSALSVFGVVGYADYSALSGTADDLDPGTRTALAWCREKGGK